MTEHSKQEDEMALITMEAVVSIINFSARKQILRTRLMKRMTDEKGWDTACISGIYSWGKCIVFFRACIRTASTSR